MNYFLQNGERYAQFRPQYPAALARSLRSLTTGDALALDVGCGTGQLTALLAGHFEQLVGVDSSEEQLAHAVRKDNVTYLRASAHAVGLVDHSVDLVVVAQAAHWFDLTSFYREVRRVSRDGAVIALISYGVPIIEGPADTVFRQGYWHELHDFWPAERAHVEDGYANLHFPFPALAVPAHSFSKGMTASEFIGYITTWSAFANATRQGCQDQFTPFFARLRESWPEEELREVVWPISIRAGRVHGDG